MMSGMISGMEKEWLTLKEASELTGKSLNSLRLLVHRKKIDRVRKIVDNGRNYWLIHKDTLGLTEGGGPFEEQKLQDERGIREDKELSDLFPDESVYRFAAIPLEHYEEKRKDWLQERDGLMQGIMMYRFKFEELEKQIKLLPAPPHIINEELKWKDDRLKEAQDIVQHRDEALDEAQESIRNLQKSIEEERELRNKIEEQLRVDLDRERKRSWLKKLLGLR